MISLCGPICGILEMERGRSLLKSCWTDSLFGVWSECQSCLLFWVPGPKIIRFILTQVLLHQMRHCHLVVTYSDALTTCWHHLQGGDYAWRLHKKLGDMGVFQPHPWCQACTPRLRWARLPSFLPSPSCSFPQRHGNMSVVHHHTQYLPNGNNTTRGNYISWCQSIQK